MEVHTEKHIRRINKINRAGRGFGVVSQRFLASLNETLCFVSVSPVPEHKPVRAPIIRVTLDAFECSLFVSTLSTPEYCADVWARSLHGPVAERTIFFS